MDMQVGCRWGVLLPVVAMVTVEFTDVGVTTVSKAAMSRGMSSYVFVVYSNALAAIFLLPCFILQKKPAASLPLSLLCGLFLLGLIGSSSLILAYNGINYSSPTVSSAMGNLIPIFTFVLAVIFRIEKLDLRKSSTRAKLLSTIVSTNWVFGGFLLALSCLLAAIWNIVQAPIVNNFPSKVTIVFFYIFFVTIQTTIYSLIVERNPNSWVLRPDIEMIAIVCSAMFGSVFRTAVHVWCLQQNGPIFVTMFRPLGVAIAAAMVVIFLGESLHLGSVIGSIIIAIGFYAMIWGQIKEQKIAMENEVHILASATQQAPLLPCRVAEDQ
ncbi:WAT1-related protein At5g40240-like isoform X2 [Pyrus x bretschneideri]|uniref:WAT1-related protein At5g40240-like isoform X2 n=1 Tax=Pyrus x bretschneideri TaxID=225117 RepID=UPI00202EF7A3|nr:WAT1-related protein At5g40240-like isoform X2 [Pyrus x bretschneideri]